jgi:hypothetical protein
MARWVRSASWRAMANWTLAARSRRSVSAVRPSAARAAAVFRPEKEKSNPSRPSRARGRGKRSRVAALGQTLQRRPARVAQPHALGDLVEGLAGRVVDGRAQAAAGADPRHLQQLAMAAADQQQQEGIGDFVRQPGAECVPLQVVDRDQRQVAGQRRRLAERKSDHHPADEAGTRRGRDAGQVAPAQPGFGQGPRDDAVDGFHMRPRGDFRHNAAVGGVFGDLAGDNRGQHRDAPVRVPPHDGGGGFIATGLDPEDGERGHLHCGPDARRIAAGRLLPARGSPPAVSSQPPIRIGTRGSKLALAQSGMMRDRIAAAIGAADRAEEAVPLVTITTTGDRIQDRRLLEIGGKALFTKEIEEALLDGRIDAAIHSMKDVPAENPPGW